MGYFITVKYFQQVIGKLTFRDKWKTKRCTTRSPLNERTGYACSLINISLDCLPATRYNFIAQTPSCPTHQLALGSPTLQLCQFKQSVTLSNYYIRPTIKTYFIKEGLHCATNLVSNKTLLAFTLVSSSFAIALLPFGLLRDKYKSNINPNSRRRIAATDLLLNRRKISSLKTKRSH